MATHVTPRQAVTANIDSRRLTTSSVAETGQNFRNQVGQNFRNPQARP